MKASTLSVVAFLLGLSQNAHADNLQAFKAADGERGGCASIPYSSLRSSCRSKQDGVNDSCKIEGRTCKNTHLKPQLEAMEGMKGKLEQLATEREKRKEELSALKSKLSNAKDDNEKRDLEGRIREVESKVAEIEKSSGEVSTRMQEKAKSIEDQRTEIRRRLEISETCARLRADVTGLFRDAISKANGEGDAEIKPLAQSLMRKWQISIDEHKIETDGAAEVAEVCRKTLRGER